MLWFYAKFCCFAYWFVIKYLIIVNFLIAVFIFVWKTIFDEKKPFIYYNDIIKKYDSIMNYRLLNDEIYTFFDALFDYKFLFDSFLWFLKLYRLFILFICAIIASLLCPILLLFTLCDLTMLIVVVFWTIINKQDKFINVPIIDLDYTWKNFFKLIKYNIKLNNIIKVRNLFLFYKNKEKMSAQMFKNILWNFSYIIFLGKPFWMLKIFMQVVVNILINTIDNFVRNKPKKILRIRIKIYRKTLKYDFMWLGHQIFLKAYFSILTPKNIKIVKGKLIL